MPTPMTPRASERFPDTIVLVHGFWVTSVRTAASNAAQEAKVTPPD